MGTGGVYHVHKQILANGSRRNLFFADLFNSSAEQSIASFDICFDAAVLIPALLDYVYCRDGSQPLLLLSETAVAFRFLARFFFTPQFPLCVYVRGMMGVDNEICLDVFHACIFH